MGGQNRRYEFASDNTAGLCPEAMEALAQANAGSCASYGEDEWTDEAAQLFRDLFECDCDVYFVFNGTAANSLALASLCQSYHSVIAHERAHIETDECGAPEFFSNGTKILLTTGEGGKLDLRRIEELITRRKDIHFPKRKVLSLTQPTEFGTVYSPEELREVGDLAHKYGLRVHMDGARFAQAVASLQVPPRAISWEAGVDVLCFGGTKGGFSLSEAVIFFNRELSSEFDYRCKQAGQLASKMRFLAAPWIPLLRNGLWLRYAARANSTARRLTEGLQQISGVRILYPCQANAVFADLPKRVHSTLRNRGWHYYTFIGGGGARFMCSWKTTVEDVEELLCDGNAKIKTQS
jgi:threonine aldolase